MKLFITGAAGFIGKKLIRKLDMSGYEVTASDITDMPVDLVSCKNVTWQSMDLANDRIHKDDIKDVDVFVHLAGATLGKKENEAYFLNANEKTTINLLEAVPNGVKFIFASSQVVYGNVANIAVDEETKFTTPSSAYACSKINAENWLRWFQSQKKGKYISLRFSGFVQGGGMIDYVIDRAIRNEAIELFSNGKICRDYLSIDKGVESILQAIERHMDDGFDAINIGSGQVVSSSEIASIICKETGSNSTIILSDKLAPQDNFIFNIEKAKNLLGFEPGDLIESVRNYANIRKNSQGMIDA